MVYLERSVYLALSELPETPNRQTFPERWLTLTRFVLFIHNPCNGDADGIYSPASFVVWKILGRDIYQLCLKTYSAT